MTKLNVKNSYDVFSVTSSPLRQWKTRHQNYVTIFFQFGPPNQNFWLCQWHVPLNNLSDVFERHAIETGIHNVIFKVSLHQFLWPLAKYAITSKMLHKKISRHV